MMLGRPEHPQAEDRPRQVPVDRLSKALDIGAGEIPCVAELLVEQLLRRVIVGKGRFQPAGEKGDAVAFLTHGREQGVESRDAA